MAMLKERYLVDERGERVAVILPLDEYNKLLEELEELDDLRAYDAAKASGEKPIPIEQAFAEIESKRNGQI